VRFAKPIDNLIPYRVNAVRVTCLADNTEQATVCGLANPRYEVVDRFPLSGWNRDRRAGPKERPHDTLSNRSRAAEYHRGSVAKISHDRAPFD
jgi:hypothetical protein